MAKTPSKKSAKAPKKAGKAGKGRSKKRVESYSTYIYKVLKQVHPDIGISKKAMNIMNSMVFDIFDQLTNQSAQLIRYTNKRTLTGKEIEASVKLLFPFDLAQHAIQEGRRAVDKFQAEN